MHYAIIYLFLNFFSGVYSCYLILKLRCNYPTVNSLQEIAYCITDKRYWVIFVSSIQFITYCLFPATHLIQVIYQSIEGHQQIDTKLSDFESIFDYGNRNQALLLLPIIAYSFQFELSLIPVQCYFEVKDHTGIKGFKASYYSLSIAGVYYIIIVLFCVFMNKMNTDLNCQDGSFFMMINRQFNQYLSVISIIIIILISMIQGLLTLHIANEQLCILYDEIVRESLTKNVKKLLSDRTQASKEIDFNNVEFTAESFDPNQALLHQAQSPIFVQRQKAFSQDYICDQSYTYLHTKSKLYWMAYMGMSNTPRIYLSLGLFLFNTLIVCSGLNITLIVHLLGSTTIPLMIYVIPGYLFYEYQKQNGKYIMSSSGKVDRQGKLAIAFAMLGIVLISLYVTSELYDITQSANQY
eukprot:403357950